MNIELEELYQQVILDHSKRPRNFGTLPDALSVHGDNPSCGDEIDLHVKFGADGGIDAGGEGAAVDEDFAGVGAVSAEEGAGDFGAACADEAREADDFAGMEGEGDVIESAGAREVFYFEEGFHFRAMISLCLGHVTR